MDTTAIIVAKFLSNFVTHSNIVNLSNSILSSMRRIDLEVLFLRNFETFSRRSSLQLVRLALDVISQAKPNINFLGSFSARFL